MQIMMPCLLLIARENFILWVYFRCLPINRENWTPQKFPAIRYIKMSKDSQVKTGFLLTVQVLAVACVDMPGSLQNAEASRNYVNEICVEP